MTRIKRVIAATTSAIAELFALCFHKRNVIIVSEHKVKHMPISGWLQLFVVVFSVVGFGWSVYSTGKFITTQSVLKIQEATLKSVVGNKIGSSFSFGTNTENNSPLASNMAALSSVDNIDLYGRIADLENKLQQSEQSKKAFVDQVRQKTSNNIESLESMIEQTGLDVDTLKKQVPAIKPKEEASKRGMFDSQGGPYVPDDSMRMGTNETEVISRLDELSALRQIVENLPVRKPVLGYQEMSQFGRRIDPFTGHLAFHSGVDLAGPPDAKIYATADGKVSFAGRQGAYGNMVDVDHGFNITTRYAHLSRILVEEGTMVKKGQVIAVQGSTGRSTGAHLHYEVRYNNQPLNPVNFLAAGRYVPKS